MEKGDIHDIACLILERHPVLHRNSASFDAIPAFVQTADKWLV